MWQSNKESSNLSELPSNVCFILKPIVQCRLTVCICSPQTPAISASSFRDPAPWKVHLEVCIYHDLSDVETQEHSIWKHLSTGEHSSGFLEGKLEAVSKPLYISARWADLTKHPISLFHDETYNISKVMARRVYGFSSCTKEDSWSLGGKDAPKENGVILFAIASGNKRKLQLIFFIPVSLTCYIFTTQWRTLLQDFKTLFQSIPSKLLFTLDFI